MLQQSANVLRQKEAKPATTSKKWAALTENKSSRLHNNNLTKKEI